MKPLSILILEDDMIIAYVLENTIRKMGDYQVHIAKSPDIALDLVRDYNPELILADINLNDPREDGIDLVSRLKKLFKFEVIYVTSNNDPSIISRAKKTQPLNYLLKPFDQTQIRVAIELAINQIAEVDRNTDVDLSHFNPVEQHIISMLTLKMQTMQIADFLGIPVKSVENHRRNIRRKLNLSGDDNSLLDWATQRYHSMNG